MDLMDGQCVRLIRGDFRTKTIYPVDPVELANKFLDVGLDLIHVVDLDGARDGKPMNLVTVELLAATGIQIELGGGLRTEKYIQQAVNSGAKEIILGSSLFHSKERLLGWYEQFPGILVASIDARHGKVAVHGWKSDTSISSTSLISQIEALGLFNRLIYTDITRDGTLAGPDLVQLLKIAQSTSLPVVVSGGIRSFPDIQTIKRFEDKGIKGVIVGKAFYEDKVTLEDMTKC